MIAKLGTQPPVLPGFSLRACRFYVSTVRDIVENANTLGAKRFQEPDPISPGLHICRLHPYNDTCGAKSSELQ
jgi:hypothetical protein